MTDTTAHGSSGDVTPPVDDKTSQTEQASSRSGLLGLWFGFHADVNRVTYAASGFGLMVVKYVVELAVLWRVTGKALSPLEFINPVLSNRQQLVTGADWLGWAWFIWTLPFLWIAVTMSVRRSITAGLSPWVGLFVFVPGLNLLVMLMLAARPDSQQQATSRSYQEQVGFVQRLRNAACGVASGLAVGIVMLGISVYGLDMYGAALFLGTPVVMGAVAVVVSNSSATRSWSSSVGLGMLSVVLAGGTLLAFALEGGICIAMAAPVMLPLGALGGVIGKIIAESSGQPVQGTLAALIFLPGWAGVESLTTPRPEFLVSSAVEINASPDQVWESVIHFPDLDEPDEWYFQLGIACPMRAEIHGQGVGAVRHCIFTTGTFVEPITVWDAPCHLAFDVEQQPAPMFEMSPYRHVHPPHLDGALRSTHGEFVLDQLPDGRTRLTGNTWYEFDMYPQTYWTLWSDLLIHRIHARVLEHVRRHAEGMSRSHGKSSTSSTFSASQP